MREERVAGHSTTDRGQVEGLPVHVNDPHRHLGTTEQRRQRHAQRASGEERRDGGELAANGVVAGGREDEPVVIREDQRFEPSPVPDMLELKAEGEIAVGATARTTLFERIHDAPVGGVGRCRYASYRLVFSAPKNRATSSAVSLNDLLSTHRVVVCVGCGGVGKTTTAASLAVRAAMSGRRVLCLTIDPAKRLANSLGLDEMTTEEQVVPAELFAQQGLELRGSLSAMMLDTKRTFDELVTRYASSPEVAERILGNKVYEYMSTSLAGTQEYMAMEKLHSVRDDGRYDLIVLDTPPTSNALDFLDAPERMAGLVDSPAMRWFIQAFQGAGKFSFNLVGKGAAFLLRGLSRFTGTGFLEVLAQFITDFNDLFGGFSERAQKVAEDLRSPEVAFVIVTSPNPLAMEEALFFARRLEEAGMRRDAFVINGMRPLFAEPTQGEQGIAEEIAPHLPNGMDAVRAASRLRRALDDARVRATADRLQADHLRERAGSDHRFVEVPAFEEDVHDLSALAEVASYLTGERSMPTVIG